MPEPIKKFIEVFVPGTSCNLKCHYCYLAQVGVSTNQRSHFCFSDEQMRRSIRKERLGGACLFNICADGETMLEPRTMSFIHGLVEEGHYVNIVTNATLTSRFDEIFSWPEDQRRNINFLASFHYLELKRLGLLDTYFNNLRRAKQSGCSSIPSIVQCEEYIPHYEEIKNLFLQNLGFLPHPIKYRDDTSADFHLKTTRSSEEYFNLGIDTFHSTLFALEKETYEKHISSFCYAGDWFFYLNLCTGDMQACYAQPIMGNLFQDPDKKLNFLAIGNHCKVSYCYNGVSRIPLGLIPEYRCGYYWQYQQCLGPDGTSSFSEYFKLVTGTKLYETNQEYTPEKKFKANQIYEKNAERLLRKESLANVKKKVFAKMKKMVRPFSQ